MNTTETAPPRKRYVPTGHDPRAAADAYHRRLIRAHGAHLAAVLFDGSQDLYRSSMAALWALCLLVAVIASTLLLILSTLLGAAAPVVLEAAEPPPVTLLVDSLTDAPRPSPAAGLRS